MIIGIASPDRFLVLVFLIILLSPILIGLIKGLTYSSKSKFGIEIHKSISKAHEFIGIGYAIVGFFVFISNETIGRIILYVPIIVLIVPFVMVLFGLIAIGIIKLFTLIGGLLRQIFVW